jgi:hypothetical protein
LGKDVRTNVDVFLAFEGSLVGRSSHSVVQVQAVRSGDTIYRKKQVVELFASLKHVQKKQLGLTTIKYF